MVVELGGKDRAYLLCGLAIDLRVDDPFVHTGPSDEQLDLSDAPDTDWYVRVRTPVAKPHMKRYLAAWVMGREYYNILMTQHDWVDGTQRSGDSGNRSFYFSQYFYFIFFICRASTIYIQINFTQICLVNQLIKVLRMSARKLTHHVTNG